jgi:hypothetical protein
VTVTLKQVSVGTELNIVQEGLPDVIPHTRATGGGTHAGIRNSGALDFLGKTPAFMSRPAVAQSCRLSLPR